MDRKGLGFRSPTVPPVGPAWGGAMPRCYRDKTINHCIGRSKACTRIACVDCLILCMPRQANSVPAAACYVWLLPPNLQSPSLLGPLQSVPSNFRPPVVICASPSLILGLTVYLKKCIYTQQYSRCFFYQLTGEFKRFY